MDPSPNDFLLEFVGHTLNSNREEGLALWSDAFDQFFIVGDIANCRRLLRIIKQSGPSSEVENETQIIGLSAQGMFEVHLGNSSEAVHCYKKALFHLRNTSDKIETKAWLLSNLGNIYYLSGQLKDAAESYSRSVDLYQEAGDERGTALVLSNLGNVFRDSGELVKAIECYQHALSWQQAHREDEQSAITLVNMGSVLQLRGTYEEAEAAYRQALEIFTRLGDLHYQAQTLGNLGTLFLEIKRLDAALDSFLRDLEINRKAGDLLGQSQSLNNLAITYRRKQNPEQARICYEESLAIKKEIGDQQGELATLINYCYLLQEMGELENLNKILTRARRLALSLDDERQLSRIEALEQEIQNLK